MRGTNEAKYIDPIHLQSFYSFPFPFNASRTQYNIYIVRDDELSHPPVVMNP